MSEQNQSPNQQRRRPLTEFERDQLRKKRDALIKKRDQELKNATSEEKEKIYEASHFTHAEVKPVTFQEKWDNYWYHYKGLTFGLAVLVLLAGLFVYDMITRDKYDLQMMCITELVNMPLDTEKFETTLAESGCVEDVDGKQGVKVFVDSVVMGYPDSETNVSDSSAQQDSATGTAVDPNFVNTQQVKYAASLSEVMDLVYIVDQANYDQLKEEKITFVDLSELFDHPNIEKDRYYLQDNPLFDELDRNDSLMLVVRDLDDTRKKDDKDLQQRLQNELNMIEKMLEKDQQS